MKLRFEIQPEGTPHIVLRAYPETLAESEPQALAAWAESESTMALRSPWRISSNSYGAYLGSTVLYSPEAVEGLKSLGWKERRCP